MPQYQITVVIVLNTAEEQQRGQTFLIECQQCAYRDITVAVQGSKYTFEWTWSTSHTIDEIEYEIILDMCQHFMLEVFPPVNEDNAIDPLNWETNSVYNDINIFTILEDITVEAV